MKVGLFVPRSIPQSIQIYVESVVQELKTLGVNVRSFAEKEPLPGDVDLYWDPRSAGGAAPYKRLSNSERPLVITVHGAAPFSMKPQEYYDRFLLGVYDLFKKKKKLHDWKSFGPRVAAIITVSHFARKEIQESLPLGRAAIIPIYHGVDHRLFKPSTDRSDGFPFLLHVSRCQPLKNLDRIIAAYEGLGNTDGVQLVAVVPGYRKAVSGKNIRLIRSAMEPENLVELYQKAIGFVFPSLRESFGMPILEAMACGCPVVTSNLSACSEVSGGAALLVDPRSVQSISAAMQKLIDDSDLRHGLRERGIQRAGMFGWRKSAEEHIAVFEDVLRRSK